VFIELRPKRFRCPTCDDHTTTTQQCDWYESRSPHTKAIDQSPLRQLINSTVSDVARKQEVSYDSVLGAINRGIDDAVNWSDLTELKVIGMDEIALRKGHRAFVVIVNLQRDDDDLALLGALPDRKIETVVALFALDITSWIDRVDRSGLKCFDSFLITLDNLLDEITEYFLDRETSGFQEGFNNKIKVLKRRCYGITNISHLFQHIWLDLEGFKLFGI
jgi:transposase